MTLETRYNDDEAEKQLFQNQDIWCDPQLSNQPRYRQHKTNLKKSVLSSLLELKIKIPFWGTIVLKINDWLENYSYPYNFYELRKLFPWENCEEFMFTLRWPKRNQSQIFKLSNRNINCWNYNCCYEPDRICFQSEILWASWESMAKFTKFKGFDLLNIPDGYTSANV